MRKIISAILLLALIVSVCSCVPHLDDSEINNENPQSPENDILITPEYKDYGRGTIDFDKIEYYRPDADTVITAYNDAKGAVESDKSDTEGILELIKAAEDLAYQYITLTTYSEIMSMKDVTNEYWNTEYSYLSENRSKVAKAAEDLYICCARSNHAEYFEEKYFGDGFIEKYIGGGIYTDVLVELLRHETELENQYSSLTENSRVQSEILVNLVKVRKQISDELGHTNYLTYAYENLSHDYTPEQAIKYILDIPKYVLPIYVVLSSGVFSKHFDDADCQEISGTTVINDMYGLICGTDNNLADIYSYMLQHKLYDISPSSTTRYDGSFCTYLYDYEAPYMFITASGCYRDYSTVAHEFGHFADSYLNNGSSTSLDLAEVSSQGLEYICLPLLADKMSDSDYKALYYSEIESALSTLVFQGFYALFEHYIYALDYEQISEAELINCMRRAAKDMGLNYEYFTSLDQIIIPHIMLYPTYVQSYCTSISVALELFTIETQNPGAGLEIYMDLILRDEEDMRFTEYLAECGLTSPFESEYLKIIADKIYYQIVGSHYYKSQTRANAA